MTDNPSEYDCIATDNPICPHCGCALTDPWELKMHDGEIMDYECEYCERSYEISLSVSYLYTTYKGVGDEVKHD